jgi:hypothetical protein
VALRIESRWGTYLILSEFSREVGVEGVRFKGKFGVVCRTAEGKRWMLAAGAETLKDEREKGGKGERGKRTRSHSPALPLSHSGRKGEDGFGFAGAPAVWKGKVASQTDRAMTLDRERPAGWPEIPEGVTHYALARTGSHRTGFPVRSVGRRHVAVDRFLLPEVKRFELMAVRYVER